jgi:ribosomal protein L37AE/L43A
MWNFINEVTVKKTRKNHNCQYCGRLILKGSRNILRWWGKFEGEFQNSYACNWCEKHKDDLTDEDTGYIDDFWGCIHDNVFYNIYDKYKKCDCPDGGEIDAEFKGDYLIWRCEDCGKEWHKEHMPVSEIL